MKFRIPIYTLKIIFPFSVLLTLISCSFGLAKQKTVFDFEKDFGGRGDGVFNNYPAFKLAAKTLSNKNNVVLNFKQGFYLIKDYKIAKGPHRNNITDIVFSDMKNTVINGNGSTIKINGNFKRTADYKMPGVNFDYSYSNTVSPFTFVNSSNLVLKNFILDGGVMQMTRDKNVVEGFCYGISISDYLPAHQSSNILIDSMVVKHFATDGMMLRSSGAHIQISHSTFTNNARQGLSMVKGKEVTVSYCNFDSTGFTGNYNGHSPQAGIDIENEYPVADLNNISITHTNFRHNVGFQFVSTANSGTVWLDSCFIADRSNGYENGFNGVGIYSVNSGIKNSIIMGMFQLETADQKYRGSQPIQIINNLIYSGVSGAISASYNTPINIKGNIFIMLPHPVKNQYFPFIRNTQALFNNNMVITHPDKLITHPNKFTALVQNVKQTENNFWLLFGKTTDEANRVATADKFYKISTDSSKLVGKQFGPVSKINSAIRNGAGLSNANLNTLMNYSFITNYDLDKFSKTVLAQADALRKEMNSISAGK